jgi:hypothetical protein
MPLEDLCPNTAVKAALRLVGLKLVCGFLQDILQIFVERF